MTQSVNGNHYLEQYKIKAPAAGVEAKNIATPPDTPEGNWNDFDAGPSEGELGYQDSFHEEAGPSPSAFSTEDQQHRLGDLLVLLSKNDKLVGEDRKRLNGQLRGLPQKLAEAGSLRSPALQAKMLAALDAEIGSVEAEILGQPAPGDEFGLGEDLESGGGQAGKGSLQSQIDSLKGQIEKSELPKKRKDELTQQLTRAEGTLEISPDQAEAVAEQVASVQEQFQGLGLHAGPALQIATELNKDIGDVETAAQEAGLNLDSLPQPPDERVMKFLQGLGVVDDSKMDEFKTIRDQRKEGMKNLKDKLAQQDAEWKANSSNMPNISDFNRSFQYWDKTDEEYQKMMGIAGEMRDKILTGLKALGYSAGAGEQGDQIAVGGATLDMLNEDSATLTLSSNLSTLSQNPDEFYPAPRNTEMCGHESEGGNGKFHQAAAGHSGYPTVSYTVD